MALLTPSGEEIVTLLNETFLPPTIFSDTNLSFGTPTDATGSDGYDTIVTATGKPGLGYYGDADIYYTRVPLSNLPSATLYSTAPFTLAMICSMLNNQYATFLDPADFETPTIPTLSDSNLTAVLTLTAASTSLGWKGSVDVTLTYAKPYLNSVMPSTALAVLTDGLSQGRFVNGKTLYWTIDFTSWRDIIASTFYKPPAHSSANAYYGFADWYTLSARLEAAGMPGIPPPYWNANWQVYDYPTSSVSDSNQSFDRVIVCTGSLWYGPYYNPRSIYFHYNVLENR